ncbi:Uncharacterised protein [Streptococcus pneumoniae]|nr:Uncharacterised protein [Streptococcus pneumoniae]
MVTIPFDHIINQTKLSLTIFKISHHNSKIFLLGYKIIGTINGINDPNLALLNRGSQTTFFSTNLILRITGQNLTNQEFLNFFVQSGHQICWRGLGFNTQVFLHMVKNVLTCFLNKLFSKFKFTFQEKSFLPLFLWQPELLGKVNSH